MVNRFCIIFIIFVSIVFSPALCIGDLNVIKEVVIAPKSVNAAANIGTLNSSANVRLDTATVDIHFGRPGKVSLAQLPLNVKAVFTLVNESAHKLKLTVGFPVSNSSYSSFELMHFSVVTDGVVREVVGYMKIGEQHDNQFLIGNAYPTGDAEKDWNGSGVIDGSEGYYDWVFTDGKKGRTTFSIDTSGNLHGKVRGSGINWNYVAQREVIVVQPPGRLETN